jgi:hypothetical protein
MSLLLVCLSVRAQAVIPAHVSIDILGFNTNTCYGMPMACKHNPQGRFQATHEFNPDTRVETKISGPVVTWTISPATDVSLTPPAGTDTATVDVKMDNDAAYGKEYSVTVTATWKVRMTATGKEDYVSDSAIVKLAAIRLVGFTVASKSPKLTYGGGQLTDNREGVATIQVEGIKDPSDISFKFAAKPVETGAIINRMGTVINFTQTENPLVFDTSKIYWYGVNPTNCCYFYTYAYQFVLKMNDCCSISNTFTVGMPREHSRMRPDMPPESMNWTELPEVVPGIDNYYRCKIVFRGFIKTGTIYGLPVTNQYADEIAKEEKRHLEQWKGQVSEAEGGCSDLFTAKGTKWWLAWIGDGPWYAYGITKEAALAEAKKKLDIAVTKEIEVSTQIRRQEKGFRELKAKEFAGYNAAWKYHCVYERVPGWGSNPVNLHHPAYPVSP